MKAAGETTRLRLLSLLDRAELTVTDLVDILDQSQPRISRHLKLLVEAGLAERFQEGAWAYFRAVDRGRARPFIDTVLNPLNLEEGLLAQDNARLNEIRLDRAKQAESYFAANAENWNKLRSLHVAEADVEREVLEMGLADRPKNILDLGTGTGRMLQLFGPHVESGLGVDTSADMLALARIALEEPEFSHLKVRRGDVYSLDPDTKYDLIVVHLVLHFLEEPGAALANAAQHLSEDGHILVVDFAPHDLEFLQHEHAHRRLGISNKQIGRWFTDAGLAVEDMRTLEPVGSNSDALTVVMWLAGQ